MLISGEWRLNLPVSIAEPDKSQETTVKGSSKEPFLVVALVLGYAVDIVPYLFNGVSGPSMIDIRAKRPWSLVF